MRICFGSDILYNNILEFQFWVMKIIMQLYTSILVKSQDTSQDFREANMFHKSRSEMQKKSNSWDLSHEVASKFAHF